MSRTRLRLTYGSVEDLFHLAGNWIEYAEAKRLAGLLDHADQFRLIDTIISASVRLEKTTGVSRRKFFV